MAMTYDPTTADPGTIQKVPAGDILIDPNVRTSIRLDKSFVSSIRVYGFQQPPVGYQDDDGKTHITIGQRRVSAALEIGWPVIPVVIKPKVEAEAERVEELRILTQLAENEHRTSLLESESAGAYKQLALLEVSEDQIARKTNSPKARIATALKVADSAIAVDAIEKHELTLDQAAILVEFENDQTAIDELQEIAQTRPEQLEHKAQQIRSRVARQRKGQSIADEARAEGWEVIVRKDGDEYGYSMPAGVKELDSLSRADDTTRTKLTVADVADIPGRVVIIDPRNGWGSSEEPRVIWGLRNHAKHGFVDRYSYSTGGGKGPLTDEEKAARRQKRTDRAEMTDATIVRRAWIKDTLLQQKHPIDAIANWIVNAMYELPDALRYDQARNDDAGLLACELLGLDIVKGTYNADLQETILKALPTASTADRIRMLLALAIARVEYPAGNSKHARFGQHTGLAPYFLQLQEWGYTLADVEQRIVDAAQTRKRAA